MNSIEFEDIVDSIVGFVPVTEVLAATLNFAEPKNQLIIIAFKRAVESNTPPLLEIDRFGDTIDASAKTKEWVLKYLMKCKKKPRLRHAAWRIQCGAGWMANEITGHGFVSKALPSEPAAPDKGEQITADRFHAEETRKRAALINELEREWPSISRDLLDASRSPELQSAKVPGKHGYWYLERVKRWGRENGKIALVHGANVGQTYDIASQLKAATTTHRIK